jgi:hypothetical protein
MASLVFDIQHPRPLVSATKDAAFLTLQVERRLSHASFLMASLVFDIQHPGLLVLATKDAAFLALEIE